MVDLPKFLMRVFVGIVHLCLVGPSTLYADESSGLKTSASVDMVGAFKADKSSDATDRFDVREAEIMFASPIDHLFDGVFSVAAHREDGVAMLEVHEAHLSSTKIIPRSRFRLGQFFLGVGRLNRFHRHEWPFIFAPKVHHVFFGSEGALDTGGEYSFLTPLPFFLELTTGVTNGWTYGHSHSEGKKPRKPTHYGRLTTYFDLPGNGGTQTGLNYLSRTAADGEQMTLLGIDMVAKWRHAGVLNVLLQGEAWQRRMKPLRGKEETAFGAYLFPQYAWNSSLQAGVLLDYYTVPTLKDITGSKVSNSENRVVPTITYKASEFSSLRIAYDWSTKKQDDQKDQNIQTIQTQATFMMGAHPAHDF